MSLAARARRPLSDAVAERIQAAILDGEFRAGERLPPERELALQLNVNRSSVREALKKLQQLRLVDIQQGSGIRVRDLEDAGFEVVGELLFRTEVPDRSWLQGLLELDEVLMPGALRLAMSRSTSTELADAARKLRALADPALHERDFIASLHALRDVLARLTRNGVLVLLFNALGRLADHPQTAPLESAVFGSRRQLLPLLQRLAVALEARDVDTAERTIRELTRRLTGSVLARADQLTSGTSESRIASGG
jgi:GntR family transcriptional repressor for pyruvate dehydrogenase complex